ncbi:MAG: ABC transporter permease [Pseudonocardia sp.]
MTAPAAPRPDAPAAAQRPEPRPAVAPTRPAAPEPARILTPRIVAATARRVLLQLRGDRRTIAMLLVVPSALLALTSAMFDSQTRFNGIALTLIGIFPFTTMFLITSIAMLRERTGGTLERLLTTPMAKLDLLLGYGIAFALAAAAQAVVTCLTAYLLLDLSTPGNPLLVGVVAVAGAVLGMAIGLLASAFATTEFQAVQFMPVVVIPQILLGGLFVPREQMASWLQAVSDVMPLTYSIDALDEVGSTSLITTEFLWDVTVVAGGALLALVLAAMTLRRRTGDPTPAQRRRHLAVPLVIVLVASGFAAAHLVDTNRYVTTDDATVDGEQRPIVATAAGTLVDWRATDGATVREDEAVGRIQMAGAMRPKVVLRAPGAGTVVLNQAVEGAHVEAGTRLAVVYDLSAVYVTARIDEDDIGDVRAGATVEIVADAAPHRPLTGVVTEVGVGTAATIDGTPPDNTSAVFDRIDQVVPVRIAITDRGGTTLVPGMNVTVRIPRD